MFRIDDKTVELTEHEVIVKTWFDGLLSIHGMSPAEALETIEGVVPDDEPNHPLARIMSDKEFTDYLRT